VYNIILDEITAGRLLNIHPNRMMEPQHNYKNVQSHDDHHDDDSSTEVESLVGIEKGWAAEDFSSRNTRRSKRSTCVSILKASRWFVVIGLQLIIVGLLAKDLGLIQSQWWKTRSTSEHEVGGDMTGWGPHSELSPFAWFLYANGN
jgi:hypothetical protein